MTSDPASIESKSFEIIAGLIGGEWPDGGERSVVMRVVHATADPEFSQRMVFSPGAVQSGMDALRAGCRVIADVNMLKAGISGGRAGSPAEVVCSISDPHVASDARSSGATRASAGMRRAAKKGLMDGAIVAVGNAPTALYEVMRLIREEGVRPALVVGVPVGFVGAAESKDELLGLKEVPYITNRGRKGGSPAAAAIINALIRLTGE